MNDLATGTIRDYFSRSCDVLRSTMDEPNFAETVAAIVDQIVEAFTRDKKILLAGNGGSAADAQHIASEFLSRLNFDRAPVAAVALTTDSSVITAIGNDYGYERLFERQVLGLGQPRDVLIAISTSGRSPNIVRALDAARTRGLVTIGLTGRSGGDMPTRCDFCLRVPSDSTPLIQQVHITVGHIICALVEERMFLRTGSPNGNTIAAR